MAVDPLLKHPALPWIVHTLLVTGGGLIGLGILQGQMMGVRDDIHAIHATQEKQEARLESTAERVANMDGKLDTLIRRDSRRADAR